MTTPTHQFDPETWRRLAAVESGAARRHRLRQLGALTALAVVAAAVAGTWAATTTGTAVEVAPAPLVISQETT